MASKDLKLDSHNMRRLNGNTDLEGWWYEEPHGVCVVIDHSPAAIGAQFRITWRALRTALERYDRED